MTSNDDLSSAEQRKRTDFDDLQNETAGREAGRISRFFNAETSGPKAEREKQARGQSRLTALEALLLSDPEYAALYHDVGDLLAKAEAATEKALAKAEINLSRVEDVLSDTLESANQLPDGSAVFKDANGNVWTDSGRLLGEVEAESIVWKDGAASYEDYLDQKEAVENTQLRIEQLHRNQAELGDMRNRWNDQDNPVSMHELDDIKTEAQRGLEQIVNTGISNQLETDNSHQNTANIEMPELGG